VGNLREFLIFDRAECCFELRHNPVASDILGRLDATSSSLGLSRHQTLVSL